ncbi:histidinol-phosphate aminotransferase [Gimesia panareensis]|uniref:Histidinol-phosphate aminotransferase n=1 Tax=Gimesia panareensis TaxID=2527978 RepID=A0A517QC01_9PLAN|nr:hypothetical protein [Gimesia panareensis]QDT29166.1 histidinol-phosphate aminotransferase [Gimesia panareensis]
MNYQEYRAAKEGYLQSDPLRLDCMNTQKALSFLAPSCSSSEKTFSPQAALSIWQDVAGFDLTDLKIIPGKGVRELLAHLIEQLKQEQVEFIFPRDVYPIYHQLLSGYPCQQYRTFPQWEWDFLTNSPEHRQVLLLTQPAVPVGRYLHSQEITAVLNWLSADQRRLLIVDAAYAYEPNHSIYHQLLQSGQCVCLFSLSKPWLLPEQFGLAVSHREQLADKSLLSNDFSTDWVAPFRQHATLPAKLSALFTTEWNQLDNAIHQFAPDWQPPQSAYYSTVNISFEQLLEEHNTLGVPATVFGSDRTDATVISCLFHIQQRSLTDV